MWSLRRHHARLERQPGGDKAAYAAAIGEEKLIIVNIHDDIEDGMAYKDYINGCLYGA